MGELYGSLGGTKSTMEELIVALDNIVRALGDSSNYIKTPFCSF
jgi:hypothetical protein